MYQLELARIIQADRERGIAESLRVQRLLRASDDIETGDHGRAPAGPAPAASITLPSRGSARTVSGSSRP